MRSWKVAGEGRSQAAGREEVEARDEAAAGTAEDTPHLTASSVTPKVGDVREIC